MGKFYGYYGDAQFFDFTSVWKLFHGLKTFFLSCVNIQSCKINGSVVTLWLEKNGHGPYLKCIYCMHLYFFFFLTHMIARVSFECWRMRNINSHNQRLPVFLYKRISIKSSHNIGHGLSECTMANHGLWDMFHEKWPTERFLYIP